MNSRHDEEHPGPVEPLSHLPAQTGSRVGETPPNRNPARNAELRAHPICRLPWEQTDGRLAEQLESPAMKPLPGFRPLPELHRIDTRPIEEALAGIERIKAQLAADAAEAKRRELCAWYDDCDRRGVSTGD